MVTWEMLVHQVPGLQALLDEIITLRNGTPGLDIIQTWYGKNGFKRRMSKLVGWDAINSSDIIQSEKAYDVAYKKLRGALEGND